MMRELLHIIVLVTVFIGVVYISAYIEDQYALEDAIAHAVHECDDMPTDACLDGAALDYLHSRHGITGEKALNLLDM